jgi:hypothetical protein
MRDGEAVGDIEAMLRNTNSVRSSKVVSLSHSEFIDIGEGEMTTSTRERNSDRTPDSASRAGDHGSASLESHAFRHVS